VLPHRPKHPQQLLSQIVSILLAPALPIFSVLEAMEYIWVRLLELLAQLIEQRTLRVCLVNALAHCADEVGLNGLLVQI
jgi:hypothetical protein